MVLSIRGKKSAYMKSAVVVKISFQKQNVTTYYLPSFILDSKFGLIFLFSEICCHGGDTECSDVWAMGYITNEEECLDYHGGDMCRWTCPHHSGKTKWLLHLPSKLYKFCAV